MTIIAACPGMHTKLSYYYLYIHALLKQTGVNTQYVHQFHGQLTCSLQAAELCPHPIILSPFVAV